MSLFPIYLKLENVLIYAFQRLQLLTLVLTHSSTLSSSFRGLADICNRILPKSF